MRAYLDNMQPRTIGEVAEFLCDERRAHGNGAIVDGKTVPSIQPPRCR